jgi:hypothetical protein
MAALWHNISIWGQTAALAEQTCIQAAELPRPGSGPIAASGLPGQIDGVPFLANGFDACVAFYGGPRSSGLSVPREFRWDDRKRRIVAR